MRIRSLGVVTVLGLELLTILTLFAFYLSGIGGIWTIAGMAFDLVTVVIGASYLPAITLNGLVASAVLAAGGLWFFGFLVPTGPTNAQIDLVLNIEVSTLGILGLEVGRALLLLGLIATVATVHKFFSEGTL